MRIRGLGLLAGLVVMGVACPTAVRAGEIRILFATSHDDHVEAQVRKLERAIRDRPGSLAVADSLSEAHVVVQFMQYRRSRSEKGEVMFSWRGHARLVKQPREMTISATPLPERFELAIIGEDGRESERAMKALALMLSKTLRPRARKPVGEAI